MKIRNWDGGGSQYDRRRIVLASLVMAFGFMVVLGLYGIIMQDSYTPPIQEQRWRCNAKYPDTTLQMLKHTLEARGIRRVAIIGLFKDCAHVLPSIEDAIFQVASVLSPGSVFVSFLESGSSRGDQTPSFLRDMGERLQALGVSNVISTGNPRISADWRPNSHGNRIDFLGRLRNAAMMPAFSSHPVGHFDKFFFVNDVFICGGDILRLLAHDSDIACGLDFGEYTARVSSGIYDTWVLDPLWRDNTKPMTLANMTNFAPFEANAPTMNVFSCWNGGIASRAALWYNGVRFRRGMPELGPEDCSQSESSLWSLDAHRLGYHNVVVDPSIQLAYTWGWYTTYFKNSNRRAKKAVDTPNVHSIGMDLSTISYRCCEIGDTQQYIGWDKCQPRALESPGRAECDQDAAKCLRYPASRWEQWDWRSVYREGAVEVPSRRRSALHPMD